MMNEAINPETIKPWTLSPLQANKLDSKKTRDAVMLCRQSDCPNSKASSAKMFACGGCKRVYYCSKKCQKANWKQHKIECQSIQASRADQDSRAVAESGASSQPAVLPSQVMDELAAFRNHFQPSLMFAALNGLADPISGIPYGWHSNALFVELERLPSPLPSSRPWARFKLIESEVYPLPPAAEGSTEHYDTWKRARDARAAEHAKLGIWTITICVNCKREGENWGSPHLFNILYPRNTPIQEKVERNIDWRGVLRRAIESQSSLEAA